MKETDKTTTDEEEERLWMSTLSEAVEGAREFRKLAKKAERDYWIALIGGSALAYGGGVLLVLSIVNIVAKLMA